MRLMKLACFSAILATGLAHATGVPCNGFDIKIKNNTSDDLLVSSIHIHNANMQPSSMQKLNSHSEQTFTVNNSIDGSTLNGFFELYSISLPSKRVRIIFDLKNKHLICHHQDKEIVADYHVSKRRLPGHVTYTIE